MMRWATPALFGAASGLAAVLAWQFGSFGPPEPTAVPRASVAVASGQRAEAPDRTDGWLSTILARPLLSSDRRPAPESVNVSGEPVADGLPRLCGVMVGPFGRTAIFAVDGGKPIVVPEGGRIGAWTVRAIETRAVQVVGPGGPRTVHPGFAASPPASPNSGAATAQRVGLSLAQ